MTAVGAIAANTFQSNAAYLGGTSRGALSTWGNWVLGVKQSEAFSEEFEKLVRGTKNATTGKFEGGRGIIGFGKSLKEAWNVSKEAVGNEKLWDVIKDAFKGIPGEFKNASAATKFLGKEGKIWKSLGVIGKRFAFIGNIANLAFFVIPEVYKAFTDKECGGTTQGMLEIVKQFFSQLGFALGSAVGLIIPIPLLNCVIGGSLGDIGFGGAAEGIIRKLLPGQSYEERQEKKKIKDEEKNKLTQQGDSSTPTPVPAPTPSPIPTPTATPTPTPTAETSQASSVSSGNFFANPSLLNQSKYDGDIMASNIDWSQYVKQQQQQTA